MNIEMEIEVLYDTDLAHSKRVSGQKLQAEDFEARTVTIYEISAIAPRLADGDHTMIWAGNADFICPYSYDNVKDLVSNARTEYLKKYHS